MGPTPELNHITLLYTPTATTEALKEHEVTEPQFPGHNCLDWMACESFLAPGGGNPIQPLTSQPLPISHYLNSNWMQEEWKEKKMKKWKKIFQN